MQKSFTLLFELFAAGMMLLGIASAQQTPAATTQPSQAPSGQAASTSAQSAPAKKTPSATAKKAPATSSASALTLKTQKEKASYALGMKIGGDLKRQGVKDRKSVV